MNLHKLLCERAEAKRPLRVGLIGAGKFGTMFLAQALRTPGLHLLGVADLAPARARENLTRVGWPAERIAAASLGEAVDRGTTWVGEDARALIAHPALDVIIDATGHPPSGIAHALAAIANGKHIVMVNVEADVLAGPLLAQKARAAGVVYSLAYGDQPALIAEQVDWARACGFDVVAAGKGTKYLPAYHAIDARHGLGPLRPDRGAGAHRRHERPDVQLVPGRHQVGDRDGRRRKRHRPDAGTRRAHFPALRRRRPAGDLAADLGRRPAASQRAGRGGLVAGARRHGRSIRDLRWGVYVVFEAPSDYVARCFHEYGLVTDDSGKYAAIYKPYHLIGLELGISVASAGLRGEATGSPTGFRGDAVATAKRDLAAGETLDGEGGFTVWGKLMPAADSLRVGALPIGLAHHVKLRNAVKAGAAVRWLDVVVDENSEPVRVRREMEKVFGGSSATAQRPAAE